MIQVKAEDIILKEVDLDEFWVDVSFIDSGIVPVQRCSCGQKFSLGEFDIRDNDIDYSKFWVDQCPNCHEEFIAEISVKVYRVQHG